MSQLDLLQQAEEIFFQALDCTSPAERDQVIREKCDGNEELIAEVRALLDADQRAILPSSDVAEPMPTLPQREHALESGTRIQNYRLLQKIGEGGFGVVYMAEQTRPVRRKVAIKVIKPGMDSKAVIARFEAERQALAMMDHPNIARVLDGGKTEGGYPFFVMDLVRGIPITDFCNEERSTTRERIELFQTLCAAIQHAHQKGVIHRDIKPSNVLVTLHDGMPVVKVIDFGIAKALHHELTEKTLFTGFDSMLGTPQYMSPEQTSISGLDVDTRSDIYSMGVLFYELLTGRTPVTQEEFRRASVDEVRQLIRDREPPKPSMLVSTLNDQKIQETARYRQVEPPVLKRVLRGELDWIVMKAIEKDRNRRYSSVADFGEDLGNYLLGNSVTACPPSWSYKTQKILRRYRAQFGAAALVLLAVCATAIVGLRGWANEKKLADSLEKTQSSLIDQTGASILTASGEELGEVLKSAQPMAARLVDSLHQIRETKTLTTHQLINTTLALGAFDEEEQVGDFLLDQVGSMDAGICPSLVDVLKKTGYEPLELQLRARAAEEACDLKSKARIAILGLYLGDNTVAEDMLALEVDPIQRTTFLLEFANWHADLVNLVDVASASDDKAFCSGLIQSVGQADLGRDAQLIHQRWQPQLEHWYLNAQDLLTRNSSEWLLRRWGLDVPQGQTEHATELGEKDWLVNSVGMTLHRVAPATFTMGDWEGNIRLEPWEVHDNAPAHQVAITRAFLIADREVSSEIAKEFDEAEEFIGGRWSTTDRPYDNWNRVTAMRFCNWLSRREGLEEAYFIDPEDISDITSGWNLQPDANGYRLPTEAEWELACRAGTITHYSWGNDISAESVFASNLDSESAATLPNPNGIFDMLGGLPEFCEDAYGQYRFSFDITAKIKDPFRDAHRDEDCIIRGMADWSGLRRSESRGSMLTNSPLCQSIGLRVVRSLSETTAATSRKTVSPEQIERLIRLNGDRKTPQHWGELAILNLRRNEKRRAAESFVELLKDMQPYEDWSSARSQLLVRLADDPVIFDLVRANLPGDSHVELSLARRLAFQGEWEQAGKVAVGLADRRGGQDSRWRAVGADQEWHELGLYMVLGGHHEEYMAVRSTWLTEVLNQKALFSFQWSALKAATLIPFDQNQPQDVEKMLKLIRQNRETWGGSANFGPYAYALYRAGKHQEMWDLWEENPQGGGDLRGTAYKTMAQWQIGEREEAKERLLKTLEKYERTDWASKRIWPSQLWWTHRLSAELFVAEAKAMILGDELAEANSERGE